MVKPENVSDAYPIAAVLALCAILITLSTELLKYPCIDFYQFWTIGQCVKSDPATKIYEDSEQSRLGMEYYNHAMVQPNAKRLQLGATSNQVLKTTASPFLYSCFSTAATGDYEHDLLQYQFVSMGCLLVAIYFLYRLIQISLLATLIFTPLILFFFPPYTSDATVGNVNEIQLLLFVVVVMAQISQAEGPSFFSGIVMGLSLAFKPNCIGIVFLLCLYTFARSRSRLLYSMLGGIAVGAGCAIAYASYVFGRLNCWVEWIDNARTYADHPQWCTTDMGNRSFTFTFQQLTGLDLSVPLAVITLGAPVAVLFLSKNRLFIGQSSLFVASLGALAFMLFPKLVWMHYELLSLPAIFLLLRPGPTSFSSQRTVTAIVLAFMFIDVHLVLTVGISSQILPFFTLVEIGTLYFLCLHNFWRLEQTSDTELPPGRPN
jgi:hypothetical protein